MPFDEIKVSPGEPISEKSRAVAALLCYLLGPFGLHRFYVGKIASGIIYLLTLGFMGFGVMIDLVIILIGNFTDSKGLLVKDWKLESFKYTQPNLKNVTESDSTKIFCAQCGKDNESIAKYCIICGSPIKK